MFTVMSYWRVLALSSLLVVLDSTFLFADYQDVHPCDKVAAHPQDKQRWGEGIDDKSVAPALAISRCTAAVKEHPDTPRFHFQLGRALWIAQRYKEAVSHLAQAGEMNYAAAFAYLGDAYKNGVGGVRVDQARSMKFYEAAADGGFDDARGMLSAALGEAKKNTFTTEGFLEPEIIQGLYTGDFSLFPAKYEKWFIDSYLNEFSNAFSGEVKFADVRSENQSVCGLLYDPEIPQIAVNRLLHDHPSFRGSNDPMVQGANIWGEFFKTMSEMQQPGGALAAMNKNNLDGGMALQTLKRKAQRDALNVISTYGCDSPVAKQVYGNIKPYFLGKVSHAPITNPQLTESLTRGCYDFARQGGGSEADRQQKCTCTTNAILKSGIPEDEQELLAASFTQKRLDRVQNKYPRLVENMNSCGVSFTGQVNQSPLRGGRKSSLMDSCLVRHPRVFCNCFVPYAETNLSADRKSQLLEDFWSATGSLYREDLGSRRQLESCK